MIDERECDLAPSQLQLKDVVYEELVPRFLADELFAAFFVRDPLTALVDFTLAFSWATTSTEAAVLVDFRRAPLDFTCFRSCFNAVIASLQSGSKYFGTIARFS